MYYMDWDKAYNELKKRGIKEADFGLAQDWFWTADKMWKDGKPVNGNAYLSSSWASPVVCWDNEDGTTTTLDCCTDVKSGHYWPGKYNVIGESV